MNRLSDWSNTLLWVIYLTLLAVLLPHTAWAFSQFEPQTAGWLGVPWVVVTAWAAAFAFEAAIAALTHRLARRIEHPPRYTAGHVLLRRFCFQYVNVYAAGLFVALGVSALANFAHAVEYSQAFAVFGRYNVPSLLYSLTFGAILPLVSLLFARILGDTAETEATADPELTRAKQTIKELQADLKAAVERVTDAEARVLAAEQRFAGAGDLFIHLFAEEKRQRILAAAEHWPELPAASIAIISSASPGYVSEVMKARDDSCPQGLPIQTIETSVGCCRLSREDIPIHHLWIVGGGTSGQKRSPSPVSGKFDHPKPVLACAPLSPRALLIGKRFRGRACARRPSACVRANPRVARHARGSQSLVR